LALGGVNVIHAAALAGSAGENLKKHLAALTQFRGDSAMEPAQNTMDALKDTE
jgi:hypothetical protein